MNRPDELATETEIQNSQRRTGEAGSALLGAATAGIGGLGAKQMAKVIPFLSKYISPDLAFKGINKVAPGVGTFLKNGMVQGLSLASGLEYLKGEAENTAEPAKPDRNIIEQVSPELHSFMSDQIKKGRNGYQAGAIAQKDKRFASVIDKLQKDHKVSWADIIDQIYGQGTAPKKQGGMMQQESDRFNQQYGQEQGTGSAPVEPPNFSRQPQGQQPGPGMQAISAVLNKINQRLGG